MSTPKKLSLLMFVIALCFYQGCRTVEPITTVLSVDLNRFMGKWYVIANIPTFIEKNAYNAIEIYERNPDGTIATTFQFNQGALDGPEKKYSPKGFIRDKTSNAVWDMQFLWPFRAEYRIVYLNEDYTQTVIGRSKRDYVWIMARTPSIPPEDYAHILKLLETLGYDAEKVKQIPHTQAP